MAHPFRQLLCISFFLPLYAHPQSKPVIDTNTLRHWEELVSGGISPNGRYTFHDTRFTESTQQNLYITDAHTQQQHRFPQAGQCNFTAGNQFAFFIKDPDTLCRFQTTDATVVSTTGVSSYTLHTINNSSFLSFIQQPARRFLLQNPQQTILYQKNNTTSFRVTEDQRTILLQSDTSIQGTPCQLLTCLQYQNAQFGESWQIILSLQQRQWAGSPDGQLLATLQDTTIQTQQHSILRIYYQGVLQQTYPLHNLPAVQFIEKFSTNGKHLYFRTTAPPQNAPPQKNANVTIWHYLSNLLPSQQWATPPPAYLHVLHLQTGITQQLEYTNERFTFYTGNDTFGTVSLLKGNREERNWNADAKEKYYLVNTSTGSRTPLPYRPLGMSPLGRYLLCREDSTASLYSLQLSTGRWQNLTPPLYQGRAREQKDHPFPRTHQLQHIACWLPEDSAVWVYDQYDILQLPLSPHRQVRNITAGYGRKYHISFGLSPTTTSVTDSTLLLTAFNVVNKQNGFYRLRPGNKQPLQALIMSNHVYYVSYHQADFQSAWPVLKAAAAPVYLVQRSNAAQSPNYFLTRNFQTFQPVSHITPEQSCNWLSTELLQGKTKNGSLLQAVLYKPENFNSHKKYPVIIHYYERMTNQLNEFKNPALSTGAINIPWFVSHGYLVCTPDIYYTPGHTGQNALASAEGTVQLLKQLPYVNPSRIAVQGHSFAGFETNYIVAHSSSFACAVSSAGVSDMISSYNSISTREGKSNQWFFELHQYRMGAPLWQNPTAYLRNSPVLYAHQVTTPLLLLSNPNDRAVPDTQGLEFFLALRRLRKPVWLLQYSNEAHILDNYYNQLDYTQRLQQFFGHYLQQATAPGWMVEHP